MQLQPRGARADGVSGADYRGLVGSLEATPSRYQAMTKGPHHGALCPDVDLPILPPHVRGCEGHEARIDPVQQVRQDDENLISSCRGLVTRADLGGL